LRWVGIDEAGYGPNLGPMVITAVVADTAAASGRSGNHGSTIDFWRDLESTIDRAGGDPARLWIDDSKAILHRGKGRQRLELACLAAVHAVGNVLPGSVSELLDALNAGSAADAELSRWLDSERVDPPWPLPASRPMVENLVASRPLVPRAAVWRLRAVRSVVVGPARFNSDLAALGLKSRVHFAAFARLLRGIWDLAADGQVTYVHSDKHGGRHYYLGPLSDAFPDAWIDRGPEGSELSRYTIRDPVRRLELSLLPRADGSEGLVALASIVSKSVRELWMDAFNAYWLARVPGLRPTAGYPLDALRFRRAIEAAAVADGCEPLAWWREK
jgi:hypothetical protein